jgi:phospholipase/carboxylesterase
LIVALHGWGANAQNLASVVPLLNLPDYQFLFPDASFPHPYTSTGKMWYDLAYEKGKGLPESRKLLRDFLQSLESSTGVPLSRTILSGFSQGAAMALDVGLSLPLASLVALSGYLHPISEPAGGRFPPVLIVHGRQDSVVPLKAAQQARESLVALGVSVQYQEFDMGHEIRPEVLTTIRNFVLASSKISSAP